MAQGKTKLAAQKQASGGRKKVAMKKGARAIPPKKGQTVRQATQHKVSISSSPRDRDRGRGYSHVGRSFDGLSDGHGVQVVDD